jgi:hypothetical protein
MKLRRILTAGLLTLALVTVSYGGTITGGRMTASGSRAGIITGSKAGTITGGRTGTITGGRTGTITRQLDLGTAENEFLFRIISLLVNVAW